MDGTHIYNEKGKIKIEMFLYQFQPSSIQSNLSRKQSEGFQTIDAISFSLKILHAAAWETIFWSDLDAFQTVI